MLAKCGSPPLTQLQYNVVSLLFSWFALANVWLTYDIVVSFLPDQHVYVFGTAGIVGDLAASNISRTENN